MYRIKTSERNNDKATEYETKSLLYLLTKVKGHRTIDFFIIDCFNDVTGVAEGYKDSWDIQSKNVASLTPRKVGIALYTLFANYVSDLTFGHYILFLPPLKDDYVNDVSAEVFQIDNFATGKTKNIKSGLESEIERRNDADVNTSANLSQIDTFLSEVIFITDKSAVAGSGIFIWCYRDSKARPERSEGNDLSVGCAFRIKIGHYFQVMPSG